MSNVQKTTALAENPRPGPDTPLAYRRPEYPLAGCFPAEPASVLFRQRHSNPTPSGISTIGHRSHALKILCGIASRARLSDEPEIFAREALKTISRSAKTPALVKALRDGQSPLYRPGSAGASEEDCSAA